MDACRFRIVNDSLKLYCFYCFILKFSYVHDNSNNNSINNNNNNSGHLLCAGIRPKTLMAQAIIVTLSLSGNLHQNHFAFN